MEKRKDCPTCCSNFIDFKVLACCQTCCDDCLVDWIQEKLRYQKDVWIPCMNMSCNVKILFPDLYLRLPKQYKSRLESLYLSLTSPASDNTKSKESTHLCTKGKSKRLKRKLQRESKKQKKELLTEDSKQKFSKSSDCNLPIEKADECSYMRCTVCKREHICKSGGTWYSDCILPILVLFFCALSLHSLFLLIRRIFCYLGTCID